MNVLSEFRNDLLKRKELVVESEYQGNPGEVKVSEDIAGKFSSDKENVVVRHLKGNFGSNVFKIEAFVYDTQEDLKKIEPKKKEKKK